MSEPTMRPHPIRNFLKGIGNIIEFLREGVVAIAEVAIGRWPSPSSERRRAKPSPKDLGPVEKIAPFPIDD